MAEDSRRAGGDEKEKEEIAGDAVSSKAPIGETMVAGAHGSVLQTSKRRGAFRHLCQ